MSCSMAELVISDWSLFPTITMCLSFSIYYFIHLLPVVQASGVSLLP